MLKWNRPASPTRRIRWPVSRILSKNASMYHSGWLSTLVQRRRYNTRHTTRARSEPKLTAHRSLHGRPRTAIAECSTLRRHRRAQLSPILELLESTVLRGVIEALRIRTSLLRHQSGLCDHCSEGRTPRDFWSVRSNSATSDLVGLRSAVGRLVFVYYDDDAVICAPICVEASHAPLGRLYSGNSRP